MSDSTEPVRSKPQWTLTPQSLNLQTSLQRKTSFSPAVAQGLGAQTPALVNGPNALLVGNTSPPSSHIHKPTSTMLSNPRMQALRKCAQFKAAGASARHAQQHWQAGSGAACCPPQSMAAQAPTPGAACLGRLGARRMHGRPPPCKGAMCHAAGGRRAESSEVLTCAAGMKPAGPTGKGCAAARAPLSSASGPALPPPPAPLPPAPAPGAPSAPGSPLTRSAPAACDRSHKLSLLRQ